MNLIESYFNHLAQNPERIDSLLMWTVCTFICWVVIFFYRKIIITGLSGSNQLFESAEVVIFIMLWLFPPVVFYASFFKDVPFYVWVFMWAAIGWALTGRFIFDWALAFKNGSSIEQADNQKLESK